MKSIMFMIRADFVGELFSRPEHQEKTVLADKLRHEIELNDDQSGLVVTMRYDFPDNTEIQKYYMINIQKGNGDDAETNSDSQRPGRNIV